MLQKTVVKTNVNPMVYTAQKYIFPFSTLDDEKKNRNKIDETGIVAL